jgi:LPS-assembly protein
MRSLLFGAILTLTAAAAIAPNAGAQSRPSPQRDEPILFQADSVTYDETLDQVIATGKVEFAQQDRILLADTVTFNRRQQTVIATGNVVLLEPTGETMFAEYVEVTADLKNGIIRNLGMLLQNNARLAGAGGRRTDGTTTEIAKAIYSACDLCPNDPSAAPVWQVKAVRIIHDGDLKEITYHHATLEVFGMPVFYTPYLSHPDPTVKRRSGFLGPSYGTSTDFGVDIRVPYYFVLSDSADMTLAPRYMSNEGEMLIGEYRQRFNQGELNFAGSGAHVDRRSTSGSGSREVRGHVNARGRYEIDDNWRMGADIFRATDDTYLRRFGFSSPTILESRGFAEGFWGRSYAAGNLYSFQGLRIEDDLDGSPLIAPLLDYNYIQEAGFLGSYWTADANLLSLSRSVGVDSRRLSVASGWHLPGQGPLGDIYRFSLTMRGDGYSVEGVPQPTGTFFDGTETRFVPEATFDWRFPLVRHWGSFSQTVSPVVTLAAAPTANNPSGIPNEDSRAIEFDDTSLYGRRFPGLDRVEGGGRVSYGLQSLFLGPELERLGLFVGQMYRTEREEIFTVGTGLNEHFSDYVGRIDLSPTYWLDAAYRFRLDKDSLEPRVHQVSASAGVPLLTVGGTYIFFDSTGAPELPQREEAALSASSQFDPFWRARASTRRDLSNDRNLGMTLGLTYEDECLILDTIFRRTTYRDRDLAPDTALIFRITFKTIGDVHFDAF